MCPQTRNPNLDTTRDMGHKVLNHAKKRHTEETELGQEGTNRLKV